MNTLFFIVASVVVAVGLAVVENANSKHCDFVDDNGLYTLKASVLIKPNKLPDNFLLGCDKLVSFDFNNVPVGYIGDSAFGDCPNLKTIVFPKTLVQIGDDAFVNDILLESVTFTQPPPCNPPSATCTFVQWIGYEAFKNCQSLTEIVLPRKLQFIDEDAFKETGLKMINIPRGAQINTQPGRIPANSILEVNGGWKEGCYVSKGAFANIPNLKIASYTISKNYIDPEAFGVDLNDQSQIDFVTKKDNPLVGDSWHDWIA